VTKKAVLLIAIVGVICLGFWVHVQPVKAAASITWVKQDPTQPVHGLAVKVWAQFSASNGETPVLEYRINGLSTFISGVEDFPLGIDANWRFDIPAMVRGTTVTYQLHFRNLDSSLAGSTGFNWTYTVKVLDAFVDTSYDIDTANFGVTAFNNIQAAVNAVDAGATIRVNSGTYNFPTPLLIDKPVSILGIGSDTDVPLLNGKVILNSQSITPGLIKLFNFRFAVSDGAVIIGDAINAIFDQVELSNLAFGTMALADSKAIQTASSIQVRDLRITNCNIFAAQGIDLHGDFGSIAINDNTFNLTDQNAGSFSAIKIIQDTKTVDSDFSAGPISILRNTLNIPAAEPSTYQSAILNQTEFAMISKADGKILTSSGNTLVSGVITISDQSQFIQDDVAAFIPILPVRNERTLLTYATIQAAIDAALAEDTITVSAGTYDEDVLINKSLTLLGAGMENTTIRGVIGGDVATVRIQASNITVDGFSITRLGNNPTDWNNPSLNSIGISIQGITITGTTIQNNSIIGNRTGIDINNSNGHTITNNKIYENRTGLSFRNQTDSLVVDNNEIKNNWAVGVLFLDASGGTNNPVQTAVNSSFFYNDISGNWYGQVADRQTGGSLPLPGTTNLKNFMENWWGTTDPVVSTAYSAEPSYAAAIPVAYGGTATAPGGQPDILGPASANIIYDPSCGNAHCTTLEATEFSYLNSGNVLGVKAEFTFGRTSFAEASNVEIKLYSGDDLLQTNTAILGEDNPWGSTTLFTAQFDIFGEFDYVADGHWANIRETEYGKTKAPSCVVAEVTLINSDILRAENCTLTGTKPWPIATDDHYLASENVVLTVSAPGLLSNDIGFAYEPITLIVVDQPTNGTVSLKTDGSFVYTPKAGTFGVDTFTYRIETSPELTLENGQTDQALVTITVNGVPVMNPISSQNATVGEPLTFTATASDPDLPETEELQFSLQNTPVGAVIDADTGAFTWTPTPDQGGKDFTFKVCVNDGITTTCQTVTVKVAAVVVPPDEYKIYLPIIAR